MRCQDLWPKHYKYRQDMLFIAWGMGKGICNIFFFSTYVFLCEGYCNPPHLILWQSLNHCHRLEQDLVLPPEKECYHMAIN